MDTRMATRRNFSDQFKATVALEALRGDKTVQEIAAKVLSWRLSNTLDASFCVEALEDAIAKYCKPEIMNTDQGGQ